MLVGYPLSAGPLGAVYDSRFCPLFLQRLLEAYCAPLNWACDQSEIVQAFYSWYVPLFEVRR